MTDTTDKPDTLALPRVIPAIETAMVRVTSAHERPNPRIRAIVEPILAAHNVLWADVAGPTRTAALVRARRDVYVALRKAGYSLPLIGSWCNRDHSTIRHHVVKAAADAAITTKDTP